MLYVVHKLRKGCWWSDWNLGELDVNGKSVKKRIVLLWARISHLVGGSVKVGLGGPCWWCSWCVLFYSWLTMAVSGDCIQLWSHLLTCTCSRAVKRNDQNSALSGFSGSMADAALWSGPYFAWRLEVFCPCFKLVQVVILTDWWSFSHTKVTNWVVFVVHWWSFSQTWGLSFGPSHRLVVFLTDWWSLSYTDGLCHWLGDFLTDLWSFWQISSVCCHQFHCQWPHASISQDVQGVK